jgi:drug/metabolite transporter (DMT)-like permease
VTRLLNGRVNAAIWLALGTVYVVWGSTYLAIAVAVRTLPPFLMSSARFLLAGAVLYTWARSRGAAAPTTRQWLAATGVGFALLLVGNGGIAWAEQRVGSGVAALLVATTPLWLALLDRIFFGARLSLRALAGIGAGLVGVAVLVGGGGKIDVLGSIVILVASLAWAAGSLGARHPANPVQPSLAAGMQMLTAGVLLSFAGLSAGEVGRLHVEQISSGSLAAFAYLVVVGSLITYTAYTWLLRSPAPVALVGTYAYVNPIVAVALGALVLSEPFGGRTLFAGLAIVVAVVLSVEKRRRPGSLAAGIPEPAPNRVGRSVIRDRPVPTLPPLVQLRPPSLA